MRLLLLLLIPALLPAGEAPQAYLVPQTVFVGDSAQLVYPLDGLTLPRESVLLPEAELPQSDEIALTRVELDAAGQRLLVTFRAYTPGVVRMPPFVLAGRLFDTLEVRVSSILERDLDAGTASLSLSPQAASLAAPGTIWLVLALVLVVAALLFLLVSGSANHGERFFRFIEHSRKRRLLRLLRRALSRLRARLSAGGLDPAETLAHLQTEFRAFLGLYAGLDCHAFVPSEFLSLDMGAGSPSPHAIAAFFDRCDLLRFNGQRVSTEAAFSMLDETASLAAALSAALRPPPAAPSREAGAGGAGSEAGSGSSPAAPVLGEAGA